LQYRLMCAWKAHEHIDFDFADFQLDEANNSENEYYIKKVCRNKIRRAETYALLIGNDTYTKTTFVKWEVEVAIEKGCRLIGINLITAGIRMAFARHSSPTKGALFVPFSSRIVGRALEPWPNRSPRGPSQSDDWYFKDHIYAGLGYTLIRNAALLPPPPNPFLQSRPRSKNHKSPVT
jgi:hypothetical protein